jgi:hypothetical protein
MMTQGIQQNTVSPVDVSVCCEAIHLDLWGIERKPMPVANAPHFIPDSYPTLSADDYVIDPDYPVEDYF